MRVVSFKYCVPFSPTQLARTILTTDLLFLPSSTEENDESEVEFKIHRKLLRRRHVRKEQIQRRKQQAEAEKAEQKEKERRRKRRLQERKLENDTSDVEDAESLPLTAPSTPIISDATASPLTIDQSICRVSIAATPSPTCIRVPKFSPLRPQKRRKTCS